MRNLIYILLVVVLASCQTAPPVKPPNNTKWLYKACLPEAIIMQKSLSDANVKSDIIILETYRLGKPYYSHAITFYMFPTGKNMMWAWERNNGSVTIPGVFYDDAWNKALVWLNKCNTGQGEYLHEATTFDQ